MRRIATTAGIVLLGLVATVGLVVGGLRVAHADVLPGVTIAGIDVGGLDEAALRTRLQMLAEIRASEPVTFTLDASTFTLDPVDIGYGVDIDASAAAAMAPGSTGGFVDASWEHVASLWRSVPVELVESFDDADLARYVAGVASEVDHDPFPGAVHVDPQTLEVTSEPPTEGFEVDQDAAVVLAAGALSTDGAETFDLPVTRTPARVAPADVDVVVEQARAAVAAPLTLRASGATMELSPADIARLISLVEVQDGTTSTVRLDVPVDAVDEVFAEVGTRFRIDAVDATFDIPRQPPVAYDDPNDAIWVPVAATVPIVPSSPGRVFASELAAAQLSEVLAVAQRDVELRLREVEADLTTQEARDLDIDTLLSTFTTYHACCAGRVTNIQLLADLVDGTVILPGEQFSINRISGERTCSKGFQAAGMILDGEIVDVCGGGVSQFGTTAFNAAFFAGVPIDAYKAHSFYISRYPMGRESTLNLPSPDIDVKWTNDTGNGVLVRTSYTGTSITVSFYGHSDVTKVEADHGSPFNARSFSTRYKENKALPPGGSRRVQSGSGGFTVNVTRTITRSGGATTERKFTTVYVPKIEIIERNTSSAPPPQPSPGPSSSSPPPPPPPSPSPAAPSGRGNARG